jgi:hypothetical protein
LSQENNHISNKLITQIENLDREVMKSILIYGEMSLSEGQFRAFRKLVLDIYGRNGRQVRELIERTLGAGLERAGVLSNKEKGQDQSKEAVSMR